MDQEGGVHIKKKYQDEGIDIVFWIIIGIEIVIVFMLVVLL